MLPREAQVRRERSSVIEQTGDRTREELLVLGGKGVDAALHQVDRLGAGAHLLGHVKDAPVGCLQLGLGMFWRLGEDVPRSVDQATLP